MLRKLRRLRVPVCFYTCCSLCAILLFVSFNEDVKSLIQQNNRDHHHHHDGNSNSNAPNSYQSSFSSSFSSSSSGGGGVGETRSRPASSAHMTSGSSLSSESRGGGRYHHHRSELKSWRLPQRKQKQEQQQKEDVDTLQNYINENFIGRRHPRSGLQPPTPQSPAQLQQQQPRETTTIVISNLVKLARQASNNPNAFQNINSLTGAIITNDLLASSEDSNNELPPGFQELQGSSSSSTSDTDLIYPGGEANNQVRRRERHWYMTGGDYFPTPPGGLASIFYPSSPWLVASSSKPSSPDYSNLWYDKNVGNDRIIDQLMFAMDDPINYSNISWGFEGLTATTASPPSLFPALASSRSSNEPEKDNNNNNYYKKETLLEERRNSANSRNRKTHSANAHFNSFYSQSKIVSNQQQLSYSNDNRFNNNNNNNNNPPPPPSSDITTSTFRDPRLGKIKTILLYYGLGMSWGSHVTNGRQVFLQQKCPVNACRLTGNRAQLHKADIVVFKDVFMHPKIKRPQGQLWAMYMLECPLNTQNFAEKNVFNLTATYRHDSDICTPYEKWAYFQNDVRSLPQAVNYAEGKTKKVAWFVSNCVAKNNRLEYAKELAKYIEVDIYGACGSHTCSRANAKQCFEMLSRNYKFYLAFENSNCRDYISEKFFVNGLGNNVLPIVMGAHPDDYKRVAPDRSYIHVDDFSSPKELAQYLHELDTNDDLYNEYFKWKGTGEFINTHFFCRLCAIAHYAERTPKKRSHYEDFNRWWRGPHVCTRQSWRSAPDIFAQENYDTLLTRH